MRNTTVFRTKTFFLRQLKMCTLTFIPDRHEGLLLSMNRDESIDRPKAIGPEIFNRDGCLVTHPFEPNGGTWISTNSHGNSIALLNWYSAATKLSIEAPVSRGFLVKNLSPCISPSDCEEKLQSNPLKMTQPFRVVGFFLKAQKVIEWRWDGFDLETLDFAWERNMWASSGYDESTAQRERRTTLERLEQPKDVTNVEFLRRFHASHLPKMGPYSVCMHREDAETVSYTEIESTNFQTELRYFPGPLCRAPTPMIKRIHIDS